jgi:predicted histone-like DNA-binding protein
MSIVFNRVERANPQDRTKKKWYPVLKTIKKVSERDVAKEIADETTLNRKEAEMALEQLEKVMIRNLLASNSVQIGEWGSFHLTCKSEGSDGKENAGANNIKSINIRFIAGKSLRDALSNATYIPAESLVTGN